MGGLTAYLWNDVQEVWHEVKKTWRVWTYRAKPKLHDCELRGCAIKNHKFSSQNTGFDPVIKPSKEVSK